MLCHTDLPAAEPHAFGFQSKSLLHAGFTRQCDSSSGGHYTMPGEPVGLLQRPDNLSGSAWKARRTRDCSIR